MGIAQNSLVKISYKGTLEDGAVFDSSEGREPLEFIYGIGMIIPGLEKGILGLDTGDKRTVEVVPEEAYGPVMEEAIQEVPKTQFPADITLEAGMQLAAQGPQGTIPVKVVEVGEETVKVDFNHPLAGQKLKFEVEVLSVADSTEEDRTRILGPMAAGGGCSSGGCAGCSDEGCGSHPGAEESLEDAVSEDKKE